METILHECAPADNNDMDHVFTKILDRLRQAAETVEDINEKLIKRSKIVH